MAEVVNKSISAAQMTCLRKFAERINKFDANFMVFDRSGNSVLDMPAGRFETDQTRLAEYAGAVCRNGDGFKRFDDGAVFAACLKVNDDTAVAALIDTGDLNFAGMEELQRFCSEHELDYTSIERVARSSRRDSDYIEDMLMKFAEEFESFDEATRQVEMVSTQLAQTYEELVLLYNMSTNMQVTQSNSTYLQMACDQITQMVNVEGIAIFLEKEVDYNRQLMLVAGSGVISVDQTIIDVLNVRLTEELSNGTEALLDSDVDGSFKYDWPDQIKNIIAVGLHSNEKVIGLMVATNIIGKPDFDSIEVKLFNSVANQCAVFVENGRLFGDLKELFIGTLKTLANSIDAKDQYTRGHSERVAFISRWIAERLMDSHSINEDYVHKVYLAALLHDIGKIGIDEKVLRKSGALTDEERSQIISHPRIGATILGDIKQMSDVVQGVVSHHERVDGKGYPAGLSGDRFPLMGKIISIADSFDAMTSKRVYRNAMSMQRALDEIEKGLGTQFDAEVGKVFLNSDVRKLWDFIQDGFIENWDYSNFDEYGSMAVETLLR